jgi:hypothetical protein
MFLPSPDLPQMLPWFLPTGSYTNWILLHWHKHSPLTGHPMCTLPCNRTSLPCQQSHIKLFWLSLVTWGQSWLYAPLSLYEIFHTGWVLPFSSHIYWGLGTLLIHIPLRWIGLWVDRYPLHEWDIICRAIGSCHAPSW